MPKKKTTSKTSHKQFKKIKTPTFLGILTLVFIGIITSTPLISIMAITFGLITLRIAKNKLKLVTTDERTEIVANKASRATVVITGTSLGIISLLLVLLPEQEQSYLRALAIVFSYITMYFLFVYIVSYIYFDKDSS